MKIEDGRIVDFEFDEKEIYIPKTVSLGQYTENLKMINSLETIRVEEGHPFYIEKGNCLIDKDSHQLVMGANCVNIPDDGSVTKIAHDTFLDRVELKQISIPEGITEIRARAFLGTSLTKVVLPQSLERIGSYAFNGCRHMTDVYIGPNVRYIGMGAFSGEHWYHCRFHVDERNPHFKVENNCIIGRENDELYACSNNPKIPDGVKIIAPFTFFFMTKCKRIFFPASVESISQDRREFLLCGERFGVTFVAPKGSYAIKYAKQHKIKYEEV